MSREAILSAKNSGKPLGGRGSQRSPIHSFIHSFGKKQLTERNCTIKLENWLKYNSANIQFITDKITNRINS